jgi:hypothetical protein
MMYLRIFMKVKNAPEYKHATGSKYLSCWIFRNVVDQMWHGRSAADDTARVQFRYNTTPNS